MNELVTIKKIEQAKLTIREVKKLDEIKQVLDQSEALKAYAKSAQMSAEIQADIYELNLLAERRLGEISANIDKAKGGQPYQKSTLPSDGRVETKTATLSAVGIDIRRANEAEKLAEIPEKEFFERIAHARETSKKITASLFKGIGKDLPQKQDKPRTWNYVYQSRASFANENEKVINAFEDLNKMKNDGDRVDCMRNSIDFMTDCIKAYKRAITEMGYELKE